MVNLLAQGNIPVGGTLPIAVIGLAECLTGLAMLVTLVAFARLHKDHPEHELIIRYAWLAWILVALTLCVDGAYRRY